MVKLEALGWDARWQFQLDTWSEAPGVRAGRVSRVDRDAVSVLSARGVERMQVSGAVVGDWVAIASDAIEILPARTELRRGGDARRVSDLAIAANIDTVVVVEPLAPDANRNRIERFAVLATNSGAKTLVLLTKRDLVSDQAAQDDAVQLIASLGLEAVALNANDVDEVRAFSARMSPAETYVFVGSSGAGKSTLLGSVVAGQELATGEVRGDGRGKHTTTWRELFLTDAGALVIGTPGVRSVGMTGDIEGIEASFEDIQELAGLCRFSDCTHEVEPECAVQRAIEQGDLDEDRLRRYLKLRKEAESHAARAAEQGRGGERAATKGRKHAMGVLMRAKGR